MTPSREAVTFGRFNLVTVGHIAMVHKILERWPYLSICVSSDAPPGTDPLAERFLNFPVFASQVDQKFSVENNPLEPRERARAWREAVKAAGLQSVVTVTVVRRVSRYPTEFNKSFPKSEYDLVFGDSSDSFDRTKVAVLKDVLDRPVFSVEPDVIVHASAARRAVVDGGEWSDFLSPGALDVFLAINGPERLAQAKPIV